jgi:hypothetical protein
VVDSAGAEARVQQRREIRQAQIRSGDREVFVNEQGETMSRLKEASMLAAATAAAAAARAHAQMQLAVEVMPTHRHNTHTQAGRSSILQSQPVHE